MGVDLGTSGLKCGLFDTAGNCLASARESYSSKAFGNGAEQDAGAWWQALVNAVRSCLEQQSAGRLAAMCVGGHAPAPVFVDSALEPVYPVLPWMDNRSGADREALVQTLGRLPQNGPERLTLQYAARALWMRREHAAELARSDCMLNSSDYLIARLTGRRVATGPLAPDIFAAADLSDLLPDTMVEAGQTVNGLSSNTARQLGLPDGTPVVSGGLDSFLASLGSGIQHPGDACISSGSSSIVALLSTDKDCGRFQLGDYALISRPAQPGGRLLLNACEQISQRHSLRDLLISAIHLPAPLLEQAIVDEYLPLQASGGRGYSIESSHLLGRFSLVEIIRIFLDAMLLGQRRVLQDMPVQNTAVQRVRTVGGFAQFPEFLQLQADVIGRPVEAPRIYESGTLGAAMLAAMALGLFPDHTTASLNMTHPGKAYTPHQSTAADYDKLATRIVFH